MGHSSRRAGSIMNPVMRRAIASGASIVALFCVLVCPAMLDAQSQDQLLVVDGAGIFEDRIGEVHTAAEWLQTVGADVRVRTILSFDGFGNLDLYEEDLERRSPSWLGADGNRKNNLIVILISLEERQTGLYYGELWEDAIGDNWNSLQADVMNPLFSEGDYAGGAVAGLNEIGRLIDEGGSSQPGTQGTGMSVASAVLLAFVAIAAVVIALVLYAGYRKSQARRAGLRQKALLAKQGAAAGINELIEAAQMLEIKVDVTSQRVAPEDALSIRSGLVDARRLIDIGSQRYSELSHSAADPENPKLGEAELGAIEPEFQGILDNVRQAREAIKGVEGQISALQRMVDGFPVKVTEVDAAMEMAVMKHAELSRAGFNTSYAEDMLAKSRITLSMAHDLVSKKRFREGTEYVDLAGAQARQAIQLAEELPRKKQEAEAAVPALAKRIEQVKDSIEQGRELFEMLSAEFAETTWMSVRGNGTEAENRVNWTEDALDAARVAIGMEQQEWHRALELVASGNNWLAEAESLMASISELEVSLMAARRDASGEIDAAETDIVKAREYINRYDDDIRESLEDELRAAGATNQTAREELSQEKPDYLRVCKLAREANEAADRILLQARDEHEAAERLRAKAASALRDASAKVAMVSRFIQVRHPFVQDHARNRLVAAKETLQQAETTTDINAQINLAERAESAADDAYSLAQRDVNAGGGRPQPGSDAAGFNFPDFGIPAILFPNGGGSPTVTRPWGSRPSTGSRPGGVAKPSTSVRPGSSPRRGGGGSTSWGSGGRSGGSRSAGRGGGSRGW